MARTLQPADLRDTAGRSHGRIWAVLSPLLAFLIGLAPLGYQWWAARPALRGRVVGLSLGLTAPPPSVPKATVFTAFLYIANTKDVPVPVIDYEMRIFLGDGSARTLVPAYGLGHTLELGFDDAPDAPEVLVLPPSEASLLDRVRTAVTRDSALSGYVVFYGDSTLRRLIPRVRLKSVEVTLIDGLGGKHLIRTRASEFRPPGVLRYFLPNAEFRPRGEAVAQ